MNHYRWVKLGILGCLSAALGGSLMLPALGATPAAPMIGGYAATNPRGVPIFSAPPGAPMLIEGADFGSTAGKVAFNGVPAPLIVSWSDTEIQAIVPTAASYPFTGPVTVTANGQTASGPAFTITPPPPPPPPAGMWSVISLPPSPGDLSNLTALAVDAAGNLYVADAPAGGARIQVRDTQGNWSVLAALPASALAADAAGNLYAVVPISGSVSQIERRDARGSWSVVGVLLAPGGATLGVDAAGRLYAADGDGIQMRDVQGNWSVVLTAGDAAGQFSSPFGFAVDPVGNLYVGDIASSGDVRIWMRDSQGRWSIRSVLPSGGGSAAAVPAGGNPYVLPFGGGSGLAVDAAGNFYISWINILKVDARGSSSEIFYGTGPAQIFGPPVAVDSAGRIYWADRFHGRIVLRDLDGSWSVLAPAGRAPGQLLIPEALAMDASGNLYVQDWSNNGSIQRRDAQRNWYVVAAYGGALGQVYFPTALTVDAAGNLYVADLWSGGRIQRRDVQGNWSLFAVHSPPAYGLAVDNQGNLYAMSVIQGSGNIQKRDVRGNWSVVAAVGAAPGQVSSPSALAVDQAENLYVSESYLGNNRVQKRDAQGNWSVIAGPGSGIGQVANPVGLAVNAAGSLYVADGGRIQRRDAQGRWSLIAMDAPGENDFSSTWGALAADAAGSLCLADARNDRVLEYPVNP